MSIEGKLFRLVLLTGLLCFVLLEAVSLFGLYDVEQRAMENSRELGESAAGFAQEVAIEQTREHLSAVVEERAQRIDGEIIAIEMDVNQIAFMAERLLKHRELFLPRTLPDPFYAPIPAEEPYFFYSTQVGQNLDKEGLANEIGTISNIADMIAVIARHYTSLESSCFIGSKHGYLICADSLPPEKEFVEFTAEFRAAYDPRLRPWYQTAVQAGTCAVTDVYFSAEGYPEITCAAPYFDDDGIAGVAGISTSLKALYLQVVAAPPDSGSIHFALNQKGEVIFSSVAEGIFAADGTHTDLRQLQGTALAAEAVRMAEGRSGVSEITAEGRTYYLAYAPIPSAGWSFGTLIEKEMVVQPALEAKTHLLARANEFNASLGGIFRDNLLRTAVILLALLAILYFASRKAADRFVQPILALRAGVRDIAGGHLDRKLSIHTGDEIGELAESFNDMTDELRIYLKHLEQTTAEKERIETELALAARIQTGILPHDFPVGDGFDLFATMQPAKEVGGDFYNFFFIDAHRLIVTIADVSDKGVPAALFMVRAKTILENSVLAAEKDGRKLSDAIAMANDELCRNNEEGLFVTVFTALIDLTDRKVTFVNAGHNLPVIVSGKGNAFFLPKGKDPMLAVMDGLSFAEETCELSPGDALFLYTDGVTEAEDCELEMFSKEKMLGTLGTLAGKTAREIVTGVLTAVKNHTAGRLPHKGTGFAPPPQSDDITMLCIRWK